MQKSNEISLPSVKTQTINAADTSMVGRGLRDLQKIKEWELKFLEDRFVGWLEVMGKSIQAQGIVRIAKGVPIGFKLEQHESDLSFLTGFPVNLPLYKLDLTDCRQINDEGLACLSGLTLLQTLDLYGCDQLTDQGLVHLSNLHQLQSLDLCECNQITDEGLAQLSGLTQLQNLSLSCCIQITDEGLACLSGLTQLETLDLGGCNQITDEGLAQLSHVPNINGP